MDSSLTSEELAEIEKREKAATAGPWESGVRYDRFGVNVGLRPGEGPYSFLPAGRCFQCAETGEPPLGIERDRHGTVFHVHRVAAEARRPGPGWHAISSATTRELVVESYEGLVSAGIRPRDADFIAHARRDVPRLVEEVRRLRAAVEALDRLRRYGETVEAEMRALREELRTLRGERDELRRQRAERMEGAETARERKPLPAGR